MGGYRITKSYRAKSGRKATVRRPYASRYDNDFYVKINSIATDMIVGATGYAWA